MEEPKVVKAYEYFCGDCKQTFVAKEDITKEDVECSKCGSGFIFFSEEAYLSNFEGERNEKSR